MGAKDSKPSFITYEDAVKRVSDSELRRIREAFKRCAGASGATLSLEAFVHEVLCDGVPCEVAEWLYQACGGTKRGIALRDLLCGIVVLTKGTIEEKIKFLWILYTNNQTENGAYIYKRDFTRTLHMENSSLPPNYNQRSTEILLGLFGMGDRVTYDQFRSWLLIHKDATVLSKWLMSDVNSIQDLETPTFYQSLAGVTHLEERDIIELEKCFWSLRNSSATGELDSDSVKSLVAPPLPPAAALGLFLAFDENRDGHVDFKELCCGLSAACRGPTTERLKFCFKIFDQDGDGVLNSSELNTMVDVLCEVGNEHARNQSSRASTPDLPQGSDSSFNPHTLMDSLRDKLVSGRRVQGGDGGEIVEVEELVLAQGEFLIWAVERAEAALAPLLALVFEVCHVALGLRPHCAHHQRDIVSGWLRRANCRGFAVGQFWYLVSSEWWGAWVAWAGGACACRAPPAADDDSLAATSCSDCSASLAWRADSASLASASSSGVSSAAARPPPPGPVDNSPLLAPGAPPAARSLTGEGGALRADRPLVQHADFQLLPAPLWAALAAWHGALHPLPRQVIRPPNSDVELELYPLQLMLYRHVPSPQKTGIGGVGGYVGVPAPPEKQLAYTAAFSRLATVRQVCEFVCQCLGLARDSVRLWALDAGELLSDEDAALHALGLASGARVLLERRAPDRTWPEDAGGRAATRRPHDLPGHTGLHNLGNTCYMNAALQAVWSSSAIREYFTRGLHLYELNTTNPLGTRGALALRYGELCKEVWSCRSRVVAPLRVRWCVSVWARALRAGGQHDAQELLAWLLDALHEDLNRARPAVEAGGEAKPEEDKGEAKAEEPKGDVAGAAAAWAAHLARDWSLVSELFCGLLKSRVRCDHCRKESVKFELFNMLSLPLPMDADVRLTVKVILLDGSVPVRYGVRVPADGTYLDLKVKLAELCHVPPERMIVVELSGHTVSRVWADSARLTTAHELTAYETPATRHHHTHGEPASRAARAAGEVSVGGGHTSSLCMPALFCFKRSRSELVMSHSPPATFLRHGDDYRSNTLPMEARRESSGGSPSPSVRSLPARAPRPALARPHPPKYLIAVHRKQVRLESYFLCWQRVRPALFGAPLVVRARRGASGRELHARVWDHVARLLSARPQPATTNHAADCDDSLGYSFPFRLRVVGAGGEWCGVCPWAALCRGCLLPDTTAPLLLDSDEPDDASDCSDECWSEGEIAEPVVDGITHHDDGHDVRDTDCGKCTGVVRRLDLRSLNGVMLAVDWDPTALHLRYQATREKAVVEHRSVGVVRREAGAGVELVQCLRAFTAPERLEQRYSCAACDAHQPATKSLQLWRLPPLLIIHLKRFQFVNNKWIKSQKVVNFPFEDFDPTEFLATVPQETILRHKEISQDLLRRPSTLGDAITESDSEGEGEKETHVEERRSRLNRRRKSIEDKRRARLESTSLLTTPVVDGRLQDYHEHRLQPHRDPFDLKYRLYAIVSHTGQMSGGHYVAYARAEGASEGEGAEGEEGGEGGAGESWVCYNDSACRRVAPAAIDRSAAYLLFYEREGLAADRYMPQVAGPPPPPPDSAHSDDDLRNVCALT